MVYDDEHIEVIDEMSYWGIDSAEMRLKRLFKKVPQFYGPLENELAMAWAQFENKEVAIDHIPDEIQFIKKEPIH